MDSFTSSFSTPKRSDGTELEVTGISRSGRVRKKSSKLMDFESPGSLSELKPKKVKPQTADVSKKKPSISQSQEQNSISQPIPQTSQTQTSLIHKKCFGLPKITLRSESSIKKAKMDPSSDYETQSTNSDTEDDTFTLKNDKVNPELSSDDDENNLVIVERSSKKKVTPTKEQKKKVMFSKNLVTISKNKISSPKQIKYTAYMLWSKEMRQELLKKNPGMDFTTISKKLGELWANVPNMEKYNWGNRAKRLSEKTLIISPKKFINNEPPKKLSSKTPKSSLRSLPKSSLKSPMKSPIKSPAKTLEISNFISPLRKVSPISNRSERDANKDPSKDLKIFRPIELQPIDVAAYLKLLGESLTVIGERLKEHNGNIAVSGSLSVLLDSLLCALGSLTCLTQQIPEIGTQNSAALSKTLENIAYIMPGL